MIALIGLCIVLLYLCDLKRRNTNAICDSINGSPAANPKMEEVC